MFLFIIILNIIIANKANAEMFRDDFDFFDNSKWEISNWQSPSSTEKRHEGIFTPENVYVKNGLLILKLDQKLQNDNSTLSIGAEIFSREYFSFGTYTFRLKSSSNSKNPDTAGKPISGSVTGAFLYRENAKTEIDVEMEGNKRKSTHFITWKGRTKKEHNEEILTGYPHDSFYVYKIVWMPNEVKFYRDDVLVKIHKNVVPNQPAKMFFNHWGTDSQWWGGYATYENPRYVFVDYFQYIPE